MKQSLSNKEKNLYRKIKKILWEEWDPIGMNDGDSEWGDEYDGYVPSLFKLAINNRDVYKILNHLTELQRVSMGFTVDGTNEHDLRIANLILKVKQETIGNE